MKINWFYCSKKVGSCASFTGEVRAPVLTLFVGGNHEASNYLAELPYGGWVAQNIYYLGYASVVKLVLLFSCVRNRRICVVCHGILVKCVQF